MPSGSELPVPKEAPVEAIDRAVRAALAEDLGPGDLTTGAVIPEALGARAAIVTRERCVVAGLAVARRAFAILDPAASFPAACQDGEVAEPGDVIFRVEARARAILSGERVALNFLQRLCGIATATRRFVEKAGRPVTLLHTRKTTPGLRALERIAVAAGGGALHRFGLFDEVLLKENHFALSGLPIEVTVRRAREKVGKGVVVGAEARSHEEALAAAAGGADYVLLDNYSPETLAEEVSRLRRALASLGRSVAIEASGGIREENVAAYAAVPVDRISVGALTHSARAIDLALDVEPLGAERAR